VSESEKTKPKVDPINKPHWNKLPERKRRRYERIIRRHAKTLDYLKKH
jgi:hypothetical protein